jgi:glycosyltransferase involved in cell wall biosynthesis
MKDEHGTVLLVIPCFRESGRVAGFLRELADTFRTNASVHVLLVDDGSGADETDRLEAVVEAQRATWPRLRPLLRLPTNQGKGGAVYAGWDQRNDEAWLAFVDADGSCSAAEVQRLLAMRSDGALIASRVKMLGKSIHRHWHRHLLGRVFATVVSELLAIPVYDSQCGLKLVPRAALDAIEPRLGLHGFSFDVELICALLDHGCPVTEVPIDWHEVAGGKVHLLRDSLRMVRDVLKIRRARAHKALDTEHLDS